MKFYNIITGFIIGGLTVQSALAQITTKDEGLTSISAPKLSPEIVWFNDDIRYELATGLYFPADALGTNIFAAVGNREVDAKMGLSPVTPARLADNLQFTTKTPTLPEPGMLALVTVGGIGALLLAQRRK